MSCAQCDHTRAGYSCRSINERWFMSISRTTRGRVMLAVSLESPHCDSSRESAGRRCACCGRPPSNQCDWCVVVVGVESREGRKVVRASLSESICCARRGLRARIRHAVGRVDSSMGLCYIPTIDLATWLSTNAQRSGEEVGKRVAERVGRSPLGLTALRPRVVGETQHADGGPIATRY